MCLTVWGPTVAEPVLPASKFAAGYTAGGPPPQAALPPVSTASHQVGTVLGASSMTAHPGSATVSAPQAELNRLAAVSFLLVVFLGPLVAWLTLPMAYLAQRQTGGNGQGGTGLAKAALVISCAYLALGLAVLFLYLSAGSSMQQAAG